MESAKRKPRIHAFFLSFYEKNAELGLSEFISLIRSIGGEFDIYFIDNGKNRAVSLPEFVRYVKGDNFGWEISGWDAGIRHAGAVKDEDLYIFCNDTFCFCQDDVLACGIGISMHFESVISDCEPQGAVLCKSHFSTATSIGHDARTRMGPFHAPECAAKGWSHISWRSVGPPMSKLCPSPALDVAVGHKAGEIQ
jgi:hypothetical protein